MDGACELWTRHRRPPEELYDLQADPHEVENLANDSNHRGILDRLRGALDDWIDRTGDRGLEDEPSTTHEMWPDGNQPTTAVPDFVPNAGGNRGTDVVAGGDPRDPPVIELDGPAELSFICATEGASIRYAFGDGDWTLYTGPVQLESGETTVRATANRYGYADSDDVGLTFEVAGDE